jgi:hypothetical protein
VPDIKTFHDATTATLRAIEATATKATYDALVASKEAYIKHLEQRSNAHAFIVTAVNSHREYVAKYAAEIDATLHFPAEAAVAHFEQHLRQRVQALNLQAVSTAMREKKEAAATLADDSKAQESVLAGASSGATITKLAQREVQKELAQRGVITIQHQRNKNQRDNSTASSSAVADTRNQPAPDRSVHQQGHRDKKRAAFHDRPESEQKRGKSNAGNAFERSASTSNTNHGLGKFVFKAHHDSNTDQRSRHANSDQQQHGASSHGLFAHGSHDQRNSASKSMQKNQQGGGSANARSHTSTPRQHQPAGRRGGRAKQHRGNHARESEGN